MRRVDSFTSPSRAVTENVLATHSRPAWRAGPSGRPRPARTTRVGPGGGERRRAIVQALGLAGQQPTPGPARGRRGPAGRVRRPGREARGAGRRARPAAPPESRRRAGPWPRPARRTPSGGRRPTGWRPTPGVELVGEAGGERPQGDQGLALPGRRLDRSRGVVEALDEVPAEREPGVGRSRSAAAGTRSTRPAIAPRPVAR